ncbi:MAG: amidohydrolase family protein [Chitinophagaceae bacterium]|nr:amidohydrolase family protein [Chitinophagaceae bacterium]
MKFFVHALFFLFFFPLNIFSQVSLDNTALTGVSIIDANHKTPLANQTVLISGNKIIKIFTDGTQRIPDSFAILQLNGKFLLPGLMDSHVHMATDPSGVDNRQNTLKVLKEMLHSGITTVRDMAGDARTLAGLSRDALVGDIQSPDIYYSALMAGPQFFKDPRTIATTRGAKSGDMSYMRAVTDSTNMPLAIAEAVGTGASGIKLYADLTSELVDKITAEAHKQGLIVWGHAWVQQARPSDLVKAGVNSISHAPLVFYEKYSSVSSFPKRYRHNKEFWDMKGINLAPLFQLMKQHNTILDATLITYKRMAGRDTSMKYAYETGREITLLAYKAGVKICAGTDDDQEAFVQKEIELLVSDAGLTPIDAITAGTLHTAQLLKIDNKVGTVQSGKIADLLLLNKNPLEDIHNIESVIMVFKNGRIFKND